MCKLHVAISIHNVGDLLPALLSERQSQLQAAALSQR